MKSIDLNSDMGESFGAYKIGMDESVLKFITSANIACGWHAGDPKVMETTVRMAKDQGVGIGAHPGYPDLLGFGRRNMKCTPEEIRQYVIYQVGALQAFCRVNGVRLQHVKPHGALYLTAVDNEEIARAVAQAIVSINPDLYFVALAGKKGELMARVGEEIGLKVIYEAFPDRAYTPQGNLAPRANPGAVITDPNEVAQRALLMAKDGIVIATDGSTIELNAKTLCVHGDTPSAIKLVETIRTVFKDNDINVEPMGKL
ncbi:MAG: LamB/YcsF family protein [Deltaproteobacteria bacterium]|nr:MAG: LamB/YcsF family protein [Deltaproteobacteria bacterium]RLC23199.1 MAG: LamB/YcsF family protein [Deltaproteobacteria bacterium]